MGKWYGGKEMTPQEYGFIPVDTSRSLEGQVEIGDYLVNTNMFVFNDDTLDVVKFEKNKEGFRVVEIDKGWVVVLLDQNEQPDDKWYPVTDEAGGCGLFYVLKAKINYVSMQVPDFQVETVKKLGGRKMEEMT